MCDKFISHLKDIEYSNEDAQFYYKVLELQENERQRIARDLHDDSLKNLAHLIHRIELSSMFIDEDPISNET